VGALSEKIIKIFIIIISLSQRLLSCRVLLLFHFRKDGKKREVKQKFTRCEQFGIFKNF
jgi:hypothetical protein